MASQNIWMQSLKWTNHKNSLVEVLSNVRSRDAFCDASILCDGQFYSVHKLVMSSCSDYLRGLFEQVTQCSSNTTHPVIILHDIQHQHLQYLLDLIYLGTVDVLQSDVPHLIKVAKCLQFKGLGATNEFPDANTTENVVEENNDRNQCEVLSNELPSNDCIDPLALDSPAVAVTLPLQEDLNSSPWQDIQQQRTDSPFDRGLPEGRKWKPGGRGRPPKNLKYQKEVIKRPHGNVLRVNSEKRCLHVAESSFNRTEEVQGTTSHSIECPICQQKFPSFEIETHAASCNFPASSTSVVHSSIEASNKNNELPESKMPLNIRMKNQELKRKFPNSVIRKKRRKKPKFLLTTQSLRKKRYAAWLAKYSNLENKITSNVKNESDVILNETGGAREPKIIIKRLAMSNTVIPKVKKPRGRPPKIQKFEIKDKNEESCFKNVSHSSNMVGKKNPYSATPRTVIYPNSLQKSNSNKEVIPGSTNLKSNSYNQDASKLDSFTHSLFPNYDDFEWNVAPPGPSEILRPIKLEKDEPTHLQSNLSQHEQFDDVTIKMEPTENFMFTIESVRSIENYSEESSDNNNANNTGEDVDTYGYDNLIDNDIASNEEDYKPFGTRIKRCRRCFGCRLKENCGSCVTCNSGKKHFRCQQRQCHKLKRIKETNEEFSKIKCNETSSPGIRFVKTSDTATCSFCFKQFSGKNCKTILYRHETAHKKNQQRYACPSCDFSACWLWEIEAHKKEKHKNWNVMQKDVKVSPLSPKVNESDRNKNDSSKTKSTSFGKSKIGSSINCHYCEKTFSGAHRYSVLKNHLKIHEGQLENCPHCSYTSVFIGNVYIHIKHKHKDILENHPEYKSLSKILKAPAQLKKEPEQTKKEAPAQLKKESAQTKKEVVHKKRGPAPALSCATCGKKFRGAHKVRLLKLHVYYHKRTKLICPHCSYHCYRKPFLDMHIKKLHPDAITNQEMKIPQIRLQRLPDDVFNKNLQKEEQKPSKETTKKSLNAKSSKDAWIEAEDGKCLLCSRIFPNFSQFAVHWRSHTGEKPFTCPYCPYRSSHKSNRNWHVNKYH